MSHKSADRSQGMALPPHEETLKGICFHQLGRLRVLTEFYAQALRDEFYFDAEIQREWAEQMLPKLLDAGYPVRQFLEKWEGPASGSFVTLGTRESEFFSRNVNAAIACLTRKDCPPVNAIFGALERINIAHHRLIQWQENLQNAGVLDYQCDDSSRLGAPTLETELERNFEHFEESIGTGDQLSICRWSRLTFLIGYYCQAMVPDLWQRRWHRAVQLHVQAMARLKPGGQYHANTAKRLEWLRDITPERFEECARDFSARAAA